MIVETDDEEVSPSAQTAPPLNDYQLAAVNSRLPPSSLSPIETALYGHLFSSPIVESPINNIPTQTLPITTYLKARNLILIIWLNTPTKHLTLKDILGREEIQSILSAPFAHSLELAFAFLHRHRFINFGMQNFNM